MKGRVLGVSSFMQRLEKVGMLKRQKGLCVRVAGRVCESGRVEDSVLCESGRQDIA